MHLARDLTSQQRWFPERVFPVRPVTFLARLAAFHQEAVDPGLPVVG